MTSIRKMFGFKFKIVKYYFTNWVIKMSLVLCVFWRFQGSRVNGFSEAKKKWFFLAYRALEMVNHTIDFNLFFIKYREHTLAKKQIETLKIVSPKAVLKFSKLLTTNFLFLLKLIALFIQIYWKKKLKIQMTNELCVLCSFKYKMGDLEDFSLNSRRSL